MKLSIPRDQLLNPIPPRVFLCTTGKKRIQELQVFNRQLNGKWSTYSELSFETQREYIDMLTGETKIHPAYGKIEVPRNVLLENYGYFALQDIDDASGDSDIKTVSAFSLEYAASNRYLTNWHINTGEVDSKEVLYNEEQYGIDYNTDIDSFYKLASGQFTAYESYYQQVYTSTDNYTYEQVQVRDEQEYSDMIANNNNPNAQPHEKLYMKKFANVQFYNPNKKGLSLLHLIFENIPEWTIGDVDQSLWRKERKFSEDRISVYDFIQNNMHDTFSCVAVWDSLSGLVHFYEELEDDAEEQNDASTRFETDVFISKDNLASEIKVNYSSDNLKTKLVVTGSDDLDIREANLGRNEIMDLSFYHNLDWMEQDLYDAYNKYLDALQEAETGLDRYGLTSKTFPVSYTNAVKQWVAANNCYTELMNKVPAEGNVVLVGDEFKKLYCTYRSISNVYYNGTINSGTKWINPSDLYVDETYNTKIQTPTNSEMYVVQGYHLVYNKAQKMFAVEDEWKSNEIALIKQLNLYHVDEDTEANKQDNILLKLKNPASDIATIRIYDKRKLASDYDERFRYYTKDKDGKFSDVPIAFSDATDFNAKKDDFAKDGTEIWTNDYYIRSVVVYASTGASGVTNEFPILRWVKDELTADIMDFVKHDSDGEKILDDNGNSIPDYTISYIGTMGAYFVLAKDETQAENLQDYGVKLLEEKHKTYTTIFQAQTEAMLSKEKSQCVVQDDEPKGDYSIGTRWLDTNSNPIKLMEYQQINQEEKGWVVISEKVSDEDREGYEDYQRYLDNYQKLQTVQKVLIEKQNSAEYARYGHSVEDKSVDVSLYKPDRDDNEDGEINNDDDLRYNGHTLEADLNRIASDYFKMITGKTHTILTREMNQTFPLYTFTTSYDPIVYGLNTEKYNYFTQYYTKINAIAYAAVDIDSEDKFNEYDGSTPDKTLYVVTSGHVYAVYLDGTTPYIAYENSQGVYDMIRQYIRDNTEMNKFFTVDQWIRLSPFIKEDEFNDSNFFLTEYDSEEEKQRITKELMESASKELKTLCKPSLEFSMTMANILALPEFEPLFDQFQLGNFIKVEIREGYIKRARLLEVNINFDDLSSFDCTFGNLVTTKSEIDKHADLLKTAVTAGKQVAKASGSWQRAVDKTNQLEDDIANGLRDAALSVASSSGQSIMWDERGIVGRKLVDGTTDQYEPEQFMLTNNKLVFTNSNWESSKGVFGEFKVNNQTRWGVCSETIQNDYIKEVGLC